MKLTSDEAAAIRKLCRDSYVARDILGDIPRDLPPDSYPPDDNPRMDYRERLRAYTAKLRSYIVTMAAELDELPDDASRLGSEAVGILLALRDLDHHFPELSQ